MGVLVKQAVQCLLCWGRGSHGLHAHSCCNTHLVPHVILSLILLTHPLNFPEPPRQPGSMCLIHPQPLSSPRPEGSAGREGSSSCAFQPALGGQVWPCPVVLWSLVFTGPLRWASPKQD